MFKTIAKAFHTDEETAIFATLYAAATTAVVTVAAGATVVAVKTLSK